MPPRDAEKQPLAHGQYSLPDDEAAIYGLNTDMVRDGIVAMFILAFIIVIILFGTRHSGLQHLDAYFGEIRFAHFLGL
jgi:hypothetical protein